MKSSKNSVDNFDAVLQVSIRAEKQTQVESNLDVLPIPLAALFDFKTVVK